MVQADRNGARRPSERLQMFGLEDDNGSRQQLFPVVDKRAQKCGFNTFSHTILTPTHTAAQVTKTTPTAPIHTVNRSFES